MQWELRASTGRWISAIPPTPSTQRPHGESAQTTPHRPHPPDIVLTAIKGRRAFRYCLARGTHLKAALIYTKGQNNPQAAPTSGSKLIPSLSPWLRSPEPSCT